MLQASSKTINITPPIGANMAGFEVRTHGSTGILNELFANILVLSDVKKRKIVFVTLDVLGIDLQLVHYVRKTVSEKSGIPVDAVMICASHTHSGPVATRIEAMRTIGPMAGWKQRESNNLLEEDSHSNFIDHDEAYYCQLKEKIAHGILWANDTLEPVTMGFHQTSLDGLASNRIDPSYYYDNTVTVLRVNRLDQSPLAIFTQFSCHPTVLDASNYYYSGDFVSFYQEEIQKVFPGCVALFVQGCAGDTSTRHYRKGSGVAEAQRMGRLLAGEVLKSAMLIDSHNNYTLDAATVPLTLKVRQFDSDEICNQKIADAKAKIERLQKENASKNIQRTAHVELEGAKRLLRIKKTTFFEQVVSEMQIFRIGDWKIISTPAETFGEIGRDIRKLDPSGKLTVTGYTNDSMGYIPTCETFKNPNGYEVNIALFQEDTHQLLIDTAQSLLKKV